MKKKARELTVLMNGIEVGTLQKSADGGLSFSYNFNWLNTAGARPISLSLPLLEKPFSGDIVYNFFDNLLPDNPQIRTQIQTRFHTQTDQPFDLLSSIGRDCIGAIQLLEGDISQPSHDMSFESLTEKDVASILRSTQINPLGMIEDDNDFRISLAGAQEKTALLYWNKKWNRPHGTTPTSHIFKLPIGYLPHQQIDLTDSCENEWLCSEIAAGFGLPIAKSTIQHFEAIKVLVVERFDRRLAKNGKHLLRLPQEDTCQALGMSPNSKYQDQGGPGIENVMNLLLGSADPEYDRDLFFKSQILFWLLAAIDGHAKNFSLHINAGGTYQLTPLYDILSAYPLIANKQLQAKKIKMAMALKGKNNHYHWHTVQRRHFISTSKAVGYSPERAELLLSDMLVKVDEVIERVSAKLPSRFPGKISDPIFEGMRKMKRKLND